MTDAPPAHRPRLTPLYASGAWFAGFLLFVGLSFLKLSKTGTLVGLYVTAVVGACLCGLLLYGWGRRDRTWSDLLVALGLLVVANRGLNSEFVHQRVADTAANLLPGAGGVYLTQLLFAGLTDLLLVGTAVVAGELLAKGLRAPSYLIIAAVVGAVADIFSVSVGPTAALVKSARAVQFMALHWPAFGMRDVLPFMGVGDPLFLSLFLSGARKFDLGVRRVFGAMLIAFVVGYACTILAEWFFQIHGLPALPFMCVAFFLATHGRLPLTGDEKSQVLKVSLLFAGAFLALGIAKLTGLL